MERLSLPVPPSPAFANWDGELQELAAEDRVFN